jgi:ketosteroid isomerase-like protein
MVPDARQGAADTNRQFMTAFERQDAAAIAELYTETGRLLPPNSETLTGKSAIAAFWKGAMDMGIATVVLSTQEFEVQGETAIEIGKYDLAGKEGPMDSGKYVVIWRMEGGSWKLHRDIWNSSMPPQ